MSTATYEPIASASLNGASSVLIDNIPQTYTDLRVVVHATGGAYPRLRINGNTSKIYYQIYGGSNSGNLFRGTYSDLESFIVIAASAASADSPIMLVMDWLDYTNATAYKSAISQVTILRSEIASEVIENHAFSWDNNSAITSMTFLAASGNFSVGNVTIYGIKKAA